MGSSARVLYLFMAAMAFKDLGSTGLVLWLLAICIMALADKHDHSEKGEQ